MIEIVCEVCGGTFQVKPSRLARYRTRFCSRDCKSSAGPLTEPRQGWIDGDVGYLPATRGLVALVDPDLLPELTRWNWSAIPCAGPSYIYLYRHVRLGPGCFGKLALHRVVVGADVDELVDHINGNTLDNRRSNLRCCSHTENNRHSRGKAGTSSRFKGVTWDRDRKRWAAAIEVGGRSRFLGRFQDETAAAAAYNSAAVEAHGEFAWLNPVTR